MDVDVAVSQEEGFYPGLREEGLLEKNLETASFALESKTIYEIPGVRFLQNEWDLHRRKETPDVLQKRVNIRGLSGDAEAECRNRISAAKSAFPEFVTRGTKFEITNEKPRGFEGISGGAYEFGNRIKVNSNTSKFPLEMSQKIIIHEITHRGMKFLATHNPEGFKKVMREFVELYKKRPRLVLDNTQAKEFINRRIEAFTRFGIPPMVDEASVDLVTAVIFKKLNGQPPGQFREPRTIAYNYTLWEPEIQHATDTFLSELSKVEKNDGQ